MFFLSITILLSYPKILAYRSWFTVSPSRRSFRSLNEKKEGKRNVRKKKQNYRLLLADKFLTSPSFRAGPNLRIENFHYTSADLRRISSSSISWWQPCFTLRFVAAKCRLTHIWWRLFCIVDGDVANVFVMHTIGRTILIMVRHKIDGENDFGV